MRDYVSLKQNKDFLRLYHRGRSEARPGIVVYAAKNREGACRVGITTSKKIGNAVQRNRSRRLIRAAWQQLCREEKFAGGWDFVFVARNKTKFLKSTAVSAQMKEAMQALGALK